MGCVRINASLCLDETDESTYKLAEVYTMTCAYNFIFKKENIPSFFMRTERGIYVCICDIYYILNILIRHRVIHILYE